MPETKTQHRTVSESDPAFHAQRAEISDLAWRQSEVLGSKVLESLMYLDRVPMDDETRKSAEERLSLRVLETKKQVADLSSRKIGSHSLIDRFLEHEVLRARNKISIPQSDFEKEPEWLQYLALQGYLHEALSGKKINYTKELLEAPDEVFIGFLNWNAEEVEAENSSLHEQLPQMEHKFLEKLKTAIAQNRVHGLDDNKIKSRLKNLDVSIVDLLVASLEGMGGCYRGWTHEISIADRLDEKRRFKVYAHEMIHALAGMTVVASRLKYQDDESEGEKFEQDVYRQTRSGMRVIAEDIYGITTEDHDELRHPRRLRWLDEAVTEHITQLVLGEGYHISYQNEQALMLKLLTSGRQNIDMKLLMQAYFESYNPDAGKGQRAPAKRIFFEAVKDAYEPGFIGKLDAVVRKQGVKAGIDFLNSYKKSEIDKQKPEKG